MQICLPTDACGPVSRSAGYAFADLLGIVFAESLADPFADLRTVLYKIGTFRRVARATRVFFVVTTRVCFVGNLSFLLYEKKLNGASEEKSGEARSISMYHHAYT